MICPGLGVSAEALFARAARLPRVEIREPERVIGTNTVASIQSGLFYGAVGLLDGVLDRLVSVLGCQTHVIATGGQAPLVAAASRDKPPVDPGSRSMVCGLFTSESGGRPHFASARRKGSEFQAGGRGSPDHPRGGVRLVHCNLILFLGSWKP